MPSQKETDAAIKIQAAARGRAVRNSKLTAMPSQEETDAAIKIQAAARGRAVRRGA
jgi:plasmid stability protein